jgi:hypothetical protein
MDALTSPPELSGKIFRRAPSETQIRGFFHVVIQALVYQLYRSF